MTYGSDKAFNQQLVYEVLNKATSSYISSYRIMMLTLAGVITVIGGLVYCQLPRHKANA